MQPIPFFLEVEATQERCCACTRILGKMAWKTIIALNSPEFSAFEFCAQCKKEVIKLNAIYPDDTPKALEFLDELSKRRDINIGILTKEFKTEWKGRGFTRNIRSTQVRIIIRFWLKTYAYRHGDSGSTWKIQKELEETYWKKPKGG